MEYRILERFYNTNNHTHVFDRTETIGEGFHSFNAIWLALHAEISRRIMNSPVVGHLVIERIDGFGLDQENIVIADIRIDARATYELQEEGRKMPF